MKVEIEGVEVFNSRYENWDDIVDDYARDEARQGRAVPSYALEFLMGALALWVLEKAADKAVDWVLEYRKRQKEEQEKQEGAKRTAEQIERLERLEKALADVRPEVAQTAASQEAILQALRDIQARLVVTPETEAERDLARALEKTLGEVPTASVLSTTPTDQS